MYFIEKYARSYILDIGCGTEHRTFPKWEEKNLDFYGFEKFQNVINASRYRERIILSDISNSNFPKTIPDELNNKISIAFLFGGVINGIIDQQKQEITWGNLKSLLEICSYVLIDTLSHFAWFNTAENGQLVQLFRFVPIQYFYSRKEIDNLNNKYGIEIIEEKTENIGSHERIHFLLKRKGN